MSASEWPADDRIPGRPDIVSCACDCIGIRQHEHRYNSAMLLEDLRRIVDLRLPQLDVDLGSEEGIEEMRGILVRALHLAHENLRVSGAKEIGAE